MKGMTLSRAGEGAILFLLALSVLWKGGKTLEMTWLLAALAGILAIISLVPRVFGRNRGEEPGTTKTGDPHFLLWGIVLLYALWTVLSFVFSETRNYGLDEVLRDVSCILLFLWVVRIESAGNDHAFFAQFLKVMTIVTTVACIVGFFVYALEPVDRFVGTFFDHRFDTDFWPNAWGEYLLLSWPIVLIQAVHMRKWKHSWLFVIVCGLMAGCLLLSYSRGSILAMGVQLVSILVCAAFLLLRDIRYRSTAKKGLTMFAIRAFIACCIAIATFFAANAIRSSHFPVQSVTEKVTFTADEGRSSIDERAQFWGQALKASWEKPLFGYGPYSFRFVQTKDAQGVLATSDHPHNVFLKLAMERGWPAALLFLAILIGVSFPSLRMFFYKRRSEWSVEKDSRSLLLGAAVTGVIVHNLIDYNMQFVGIGFLFWIVLAFLCAPSVALLESGAQSFRQWRYARVCMKAELLLAVALLIVACTEGGYLVTSSFARHAEAAGDTEEAILWYERSDGEIYGRDLLLSKAVLLMDNGRAVESGEALASYAALNPHDARVWKLMGILALKENDPSLAFANIRKAFDLGKMTDLGITTLYLESARGAQEGNIIRDGQKDLDTLFIAYADAIGQNAHFIALSRNVEELQTVARLLGQFFPADADRYRTIARKAADHAETERARFTSRTPGMLW